MKFSLELDQPTTPLLALLLWDFFPFGAIQDVMYVHDRLDEEAVFGPYVSSRVIVEAK